MLRTPSAIAGTVLVGLMVVLAVIGPPIWGEEAARIARVETLRVLGTDYVRLARAKRLPAARLHLRHVLPNTLTATLTLGGLLLGSLIAGSVLVEYVFAWPGLGLKIVESITQKDYPVAQGVILVYGVVVLVVNLLVDLVLGTLDPTSAIKES